MCKQSQKRWRLNCGNAIDIGNNKKEPDRMLPPESSPAPFHTVENRDREAIIAFTLLALSHFIHVDVGYMYYVLNNLCKLITVSVLSYHHSHHTYKYYVLHTYSYGPHWMYGTRTRNTNIRNGAPHANAHAPASYTNQLRIRRIFPSKVVILVICEWK